MQAQLSSRLFGNRLVDPAMALPANQETGGSQFDDDNGANSLTIIAMRTRLSSVMGSTYTTKYLDSLNANDLLFALRTDGII